MMDASQIAQIIGPIMAALALGALLHPTKYKALISKFKEDQGFFLFTGILNLLVGLTILSFYNGWGVKWATLVTLFAWVLVFRGFGVFLYPKVILKMHQHQMLQRVWLHLHRERIKLQQ